MDSSPFATLPLELREQIYLFALTASGPQTLHLSSGAPQLLTQLPNPHPLALPQTCIQLRTESLPLYFHHNTFQLRTDHITTFHAGYGVRTSWLSTLSAWFSLIGDTNRRRLRHVELDFETWDFRARGLNGQTPELVIGSLLPALSLFTPRTDVLARCRLDSCYGERCNEVLVFSLQDAQAAETAVKDFMRKTSPLPPGFLVPDEWDCVNIAPLIWRANDDGTTMPRGAS